ncbi:helix-turn-helix transcriptional regulator [Actinoplanes sp. GCM10030250]|uniref:helix-turn-helix transcriptional regulator n=1 Tax=Actinoplanes sp. GCM10030250 TaxID=3273376 RepID=UPI0036183606
MAESIEILPLEVVAQAFPARPAALPDVRDFVRRQLTGKSVSDDDIRLLGERVADVLLDAAGAAGTIQVSLRLFPAGAEVDVLFAPDIAAPVRPAATAAVQAAGGQVATVQAGGRAATVQPAGRVATGRAVVSASLTEAGPVAQQAFSTWLSGRLRQEGLTMEAAARRLEVSTKTISRWVAGSTEPRLRDLYRIREEFGEPFH